MNDELMKLYEEVFGDLRLRKVEGIPVGVFKEERYENCAEKGVAFPAVDSGNHRKRGCVSGGI